MLGRTFADRYTLVERVGGGGMGIVYRARHAELDGHVAVKVIAPRLVSGPTAAERLVREARLSSRINDPHVVSAIDRGRTDDGLVFVVMPLVPGRSLTELIAAEAPLAVPRTIELATQICDGLAAAHVVEVVHRDLKPGNIMVVETHGGREQIKLLDFGLARALSNDATPLTREGALLGTAAYMSPEQAMGRPHDVRGDLYALGCVLYEMLTGRRPFADVRAVAALALHHARIEPPPPGPGVPPVLANVVMRLLEKAPADRYPSAVAAQAALQAAGQAIAAAGSRAFAPIDPSSGLSPPPPADAARSMEGAARAHATPSEAPTVDGDLPPALDASADDKAPTDRRLGRMRMPAVIVALVAAGALGVWLGGGRGEPAPPVGASSAAPDAATPMPARDPDAWGAARHRSATASVPSDAGRLGGPRIDMGRDAAAAVDGPRADATTPADGSSAASARPKPGRSRSRRARPRPAEARPPRLPPLLDPDG